MTTESKLWKKLSTGWSGLAVRTEASMGGVEVGCPDTQLSLGVYGAWVELKIWPTPLSAEQLAWHLRGVERGSTVLVLCKFVTKGKGYWVGRGDEYDRMIREKERPMVVMEWDEVVEELLRWIRGEIR